MKEKLRSLNRVLVRRGPGYLWYLFTGWFLPRLAYAHRGDLFGKLLRWNGGLPKKELLRRARSATPADRPATAFTRWSRFPLEPQVRTRINGHARQPAGDDLVVGRIDDDGRVLGLFGELPGLPNVSASDFVPRSRFSLDLVVCDDALLIRKGYRGDRTTFLHEWASLAALAGRANVPAIHHVDESRTLLYKSFVAGRTIRELLVDAGARILHAHTECDPALTGLSPQARIEAVWARGREFLPRVLNKEFLQRLEEQLDAIHGAGVTGVSLTWGNVVVGGAHNTPWLIDLDKARIAADEKSPAFQFQRDDERIKFNRLYGRYLLTEATARAALAEQSRKLPGWYAPVDFGCGLTVDRFWSTDNGTGRWAYFNGPVLDRRLTGKRILDLGSNNGLMPMMMLRAGAKEVLGVEFSPEFIEAAQLVRRLFEWRDAKRYPLNLHLGNMLDVLKHDWGQFDIVTAFCSLYYLEPADMAAVVRRAAQLAPVMVIQAKTDTRAEATENKAEKSSLLFLKQLLETNGYTHVEVLERNGFTRPILIGHRASTRKPEALALQNCTSL